MVAVVVDGSAIEMRARNGEKWIWVRKDCWYSGWRRGSNTCGGYWLNADLIDCCLWIGNIRGGFTVKVRCFPLKKWKISRLLDLQIITRSGGQPIFQPSPATQIAFNLPVIVRVANCGLQKHALQIRTYIKYPYIYSLVCPRKATPNQMSNARDHRGAQIIIIIIIIKHSNKQTQAQFSPGRIDMPPRTAPRALAHSSCIRVARALALKGQSISVLIQSCGKHLSESPRFRIVSGARARTALFATRARASDSWRRGLWHGAIYTIIHVAREQPKIYTYKIKV